VTFLGWQTREQIDDLLCAADVYLQPGTQSATMQHSLSCRCAVILDDVPAHEVYQRDNGWFVRSDDELELALRALGAADLPAMQANSYALAKEILDYRVLAERVLR
jgi:1,2-diacylglycerol 3-alpha-glucosyltransferase